LNKADPLAAPPINATTNAKVGKPAPNPTVKPSTADAIVKPTSDPSAATPPVNVAAKKMPVPDKAALAAAEARVAGAFAELTPQATLEKTKSLTDGPMVYVALNHALDGAIASGNVAVVGQILDELGRRFAVDSLSLRAKSYLDLRPHVSTAAAWEMLAESTLELIDEATAGGHADLTLPLAETSLLAARKANDLELIRKATLKALLVQAKGSGERPKEKAPDTR
jgi:hypothetical protein